MAILLIKFSENLPEDIREKYYNCTSTGKDSGYDLYFPQNICGDQGDTKLIKLGIHCQLENATHGYDLLPRSSIYKKGIRMANCQGLIDQGYTGEICAPVDFIRSYECAKGDRAFQIALPSRKPFSVKIVDELRETDRGEKGFGSTGN